MAVSCGIQNFSSLVENNFYKVLKVDSYRTAFTDNQIVYTLLDGRRLYGCPGANQIFKLYTVPFYFQYKGLSYDGIFNCYNFSVYKNVKEVLSDTYHEIMQILLDYITSKACSGCVESEPNQMAHICVTESRTDLCEKYLEVALKEHSKYQLGNIIEAFIELYDGFNFNESEIEL